MPLQPNSSSQNTAMATSAASENKGGRTTLNQLVNLCIEKEASDIHFREGGKLALRVGGKIVFIENADPLSREDAKAMVDALLPNLDERARFEKDRESDFSYTHTNAVNFRVNLFYQQGKLAGVMRMISKHVLSMDELGIPESLKKFLSLREGLILVCGPAGSGRSTTIQSMLRHINENYVKHILTIENPIEYVFEDQKSMFTQRELGKDTLSMTSALQSALREDANVVVVSEINTLDTLDNVLKLVETGHLVIASMATRDATQTLERMVNLYPQDLRKQAQDRISHTLIALVAQDLVQRTDQPGLIAVFELMFMNQSIHSIIRRGNFIQLHTAIQAASAEGMITMDNYAYQLAERGVITQADATEYIQREE
ncbi:PilT/PilU family type 4a pilus ATPase [Candidatus Peregrinibacteria bacterium]|nr:PilT/PilU family type 4a pilus ATPase [Candidatus Peregrinibacteria bacterium]